MLILSAILIMACSKDDQIQETINVNVKSYETIDGNYYTSSDSVKVEICSYIKDLNKTYHAIEFNEEIPIYGSNKLYIKASGKGLIEIKVNNVISRNNEYCEVMIQ